MVSDQEIASCVESILRRLEPSGGVVTSVNVNWVVQQLEAKLGLDLSHKAGFIRDQINLLLRQPAAPAAREHFVFQEQPQQQQQHQHHHLQQQFFHPHQLLQHHQMPSSPFTHFPNQHELAFRCAPSVPMQAHHLLQQQQQQQQQAQAGLPKPQQQQAQAGLPQQQQQAQAGLPQQQPPPPPAVAATVKQEVQDAPRGSAKGSAGSGAKKRGGPGGLSKVCGVSPELQAIVGEPTMSRTEIVRQLWAYIRKNNLQDPNNKRKIICNEELRLVFETDSTDMFKMNKLLAKHIIPLEPSKDSGPDKKKLKVTEVPPVAETEGNQSSVLISDELAKFFGTGSREMPQAEALKRVWDYIKMYQLKDPLNPKMIHCDAKLQQLFGCKSLSALGVSEMLARHMYKQS